MIASADSVAEVQEAVRTADRLIPVAAGTKPALSQAGDPDTLRLDVSRLSGLIEYDPAELTFTAHAATPIREVEAALAEHGQYLPFDPPLRAAGATLAGVLAAGTSGPAAWRHGGIRDFVIGAQIVDGRGRLVAGGGKVVKNAAGFDLPKLMVGSMGRLGVMVRLSFKVFPRPGASTTLAFAYHDPEPALAMMTRLARGPVQADALDLTPEHELLVRIGGDPAVLESRAARLAGIVDREHRRLDGAGEAAAWDSEFAWMPPGSQAVRVALTPGNALVLQDILRAIGVTLRLSLAANLAWVAWPGDREIDELDRRLSKLGLRGMRLQGDGHPLLGGSSGGAFAERIRHALDPDRKFLDF